MVCKFLLDSRCVLNAKCRFLFLHRVSIFLCRVVEARNEKEMRKTTQFILSCRQRSREEKHVRIT